MKASAACPLGAVELGLVPRRACPRLVVRLLVLRLLDKDRPLGETVKSLLSSWVKLVLLLGLKAVAVIWAANLQRIIGHCV